jgi:type II secretory pathway pseudopilin PulG
MIGRGNKLVGGYTVIELLITIAVLSMLTGLVSIGRQSYRDTILFTNLAYDVAQTIREMQVLAASGRETPGASLTYSAGYGLYFDAPSYEGNTTFKIFSDYEPTEGAQRDWRFLDSSDHDDLVGVYTLGGGAVIESVCRLETSGNCNPYGATNIIYLGPDLGACVTGADGLVGLNAGSVSQCTSLSGFTGAQIVLRSPGGRTMTIEVYSSGQISVN